VMSIASAMAPAPIISLYCAVGVSEPDCLR
jgi:hypothetical protein